MATVTETPRVSRVLVHPDDDVVVLLEDVVRGASLGDGLPVCAQGIARGHKAARRAIAKGELVRKYGAPIGRARQDIAPGDWVHTHNLETALTKSGEYVFCAPTKLIEPRDDAGCFLGYQRSNGAVGIRNEIWIVATVGCVNRTAERIASRALSFAQGRVDGVHAITHPYGCSQLGDDLARTRTILASLAQSPNVGGVLVLGLGCESNQVQELIGELDGGDGPRIRHFATQDVDDEVERGIDVVRELIAVAEHDERTPQPLFKLVLGVKCGGSDALSGLTANPLVGLVADRVTRAGGTVVLTEIPEIFGAEHILMQRAASEAVFNAIGALVNDFKRYFSAHGEPVSENPSPGNLEGGITTLEEKSLGAVQKAGSGALTSVLRYGERVNALGVALLEAPGNDAVSTTALAASGAQIILFTTGRGTPLGGPAPTLKISSNSQLATRKPHWIDFDAGPALNEGAMQASADMLMSLILRIASGERAKNELNEERETAIWKSGVTL